MIQPSSLVISLGMGSSKGRRMSLDFSHGFSIIDLLTASGTLMKLQSWDRICLAMKLAGPLSPNLLNSAAAARGAFGTGDGH